MASRFLTALLFGLSLSALACITPVRQIEQEATNYMPASGLDQANPADIAVAPVTLAMLEDGQAPTEIVRQALYKGLIDRLYSPLPLDWVDNGGARDATLQVRVLMWDTSQTAYDGTVLARVEARMTAASGALWAIDITRRLNDSKGGIGRANADVAERNAALDLAQEILSLLPERDTTR